MERATDAVCGHECARGRVDARAPNRRDAGMTRGSARRGAGHQRVGHRRVFGHAVAQSARWAVGAQPSCRCAGDIRRAGGGILFRAAHLPPGFPNRGPFRGSTSHWLVLGRCFALRHHSQSRCESARARSCPGPSGRGVGRERCVALSAVRCVSPACRDPGGAGRVRSTHLAKKKLELSHRWSRIFMDKVWCFPFPFHLFVDIRVNP